jgi:3-oxoacyl-[acyl-carrier protein] reductase
VTKRLEGKSALVTGGAQGFGLGIVETFAREGARVAVVDVNGDAARKVAEGIPGAIAVAADVSKAADVNRAVQETVQAFGGLDVLVNNAGISHRNRPMLEVEEDEFDRVFAVNVKSIYLFARAAIPQMRSQGRGVIVNVGSTAGLRPRPGLAWYNGTKGAVHSITKSMAIELAPDRIRVCALAPVAGDTPLLATFMGEDTPEKRPEHDPARPPLPPRRHRQRSAVPGLGRGGSGDRRGAGGRRRTLHLGGSFPGLRRRAGPRTVSRPTPGAVAPRTRRRYAGAFPERLSDDGQG